MSFYESDPVEAAPFLELPAFQYGSWGLPAFRRNNYSLLEPARIFLWQNCGLLGYVIPRSAIANAQVPAGILKYQQIEDRVQLPPGSFLMGLSGYSSAAAGFRFSIYDEGTKDFVLSDKWENSTDVDVSNVDDGKPHMLEDPYCVVSPGILQIKVCNLAATTNDFSLLLWFAVPKGTKGATT
jgi:hypothetical protein